MKKIIILGVCALCGIGASAQQSVLKDAERAMKDKSTLKQVVSIVTPAFTDPETKDLAQTWYIPGKTAFNEYDNLFSLKAFGKLPENGDQTMGDNLIAGYEYMMKALPLDTVTDPKGKIKTKYSKDIINTIAGHYNDYNNHALTLWDLQDYKGAYKAWGIYLEMSDNAKKFKGITVPADTTLSEIAYNQALAAWQAEDLRASLNSFLNAKDRGYTKKNIYDYAISVASALEDSTTLLSLAREALPLYGNEDPVYIRFIINDYLMKKDYVNALSAINEAIASDPNNADYYIVLGVIYDNDGKRQDAKTAYKKAIELDENASLALLYYGKSLCEDAYEASDKAPTDPSEIDAYFNANIKPLFEEAAIYLEKAYQIDNENVDVLKYLENVYYNLKDEKMLQDVEKRKSLL